MPVSADSEVKTLNVRMAVRLSKYDKNDIQ